ncbi:serine-type D-Ala-D-Ala carboxypeptidase [Glycocaulis alkaliphilus]|uniref:serine-type D-Ala-D-Ala carboxypeptidase n=1 Tax=Glycocaulis alkaliphilus TaxID=1434191 RepID=A0A3T0E9S3_9PROT|nr:D-alanyl-D-alanine carboxypeptidase family protein [Glycocaulis alkaliphilus]AZU04059.1 serine-type D-Ala-D-Ala carboxypeptidase [Glycocaulis alkaliphilus]GGB75469.1 D-alanyl-D-alanine carboxypeptidase [Glycocaulis alkaliphilus]
MVRLVAALAGLFLVFGGLASAQEPAFQTSASHAVIMDYETGEVLFSKDGSEPMPPSSMSKLMTALMVFEALEAGTLSLDDELPVSVRAWREGGAASGGSTMFLEVNSRARVDDLLRGIIVQSGNDACIVVAEAIGGSEEAFSDMMTRRAREIGLETASFRNSTGLPAEGHVISAEDLARLAAHIIRNYPQYYEFYSETTFTYNGIRQANRNPLLGVFEGADGLKTGHTSEAGYGLTASAERNGERRIIVFNGTQSMRERANEAERLMRAAFSDFVMVDLAEAGAEIGAADVYMGTARNVSLRTTAPIRAAMHRRERDRMRAEIVYDGPLTAPVAEGDEVARLVITMPDGRTREYPLEAASDVRRQGMVSRAMSALVNLVAG